MNLNACAIPVVMYHTIGRVMPDWRWSFLTVPGTVFEDHLKWLVRAGYRTADLEELHCHVAGQRLLPQRSVVLTFDDGYLDNWTYAAPLLRKYGCVGTVFVNPEFVDPRDIVRPSLDDVWERKTSEEALEVRGFMSWPELRLLAANGPLRVESHAMTHTWYPVGPQIVDFHHPGDGHFWLDWNALPERKPFYLTQPTATQIPFGTPIYEHQKSLAATKFFPNPCEAQVLADFVEEEGGGVFFARERWRETLMAKVRQLRDRGYKVGTYESEVGRIARYRFELAECQMTIEGRLGRRVKFLCWPGGACNEISRSIAVGLYAAVTLGSADPSPARNRPGEDARFIKRIGVPAIEHGRKVIYPGGRYLVQALREYQGSWLARRSRQIIKVVACGKHAVCRRP
ncbi:MAG: polysaccharide deacetylase family protein [Thermoguttaceae bacterium]